MARAEAAGRAQAASGVSASASGHPLIFSVQHFCLQDGPGVRSLVFFKGCPLRCVWCQNPESWSPGAELGFKANLCVGCGTCVKVCPHGAMGKSAAWASVPPWRNPARCRLCFSCVERCPAGALVRFGVARSVESIVEELEPEFALYRSSGGGVTFSGGEPTLHVAFAAELARRLRTEGVSVAMETGGEFALTSETGRLLRNLDLVLFDIKVFDDLEHRRLCGGPNRRVKENLAALARAAAQGRGPAVVPRLPLVPGLTDGVENLLGWGGLLRDIGLPRVDIVPYHSLGESKRAWLGLAPGPALPAPSERDLARARATLASAGIVSHEPGEAPGPGTASGPAGRP